MTEEIRRFTAGDASSVSEIICRCLREINVRDYGEEHIARMLPRFSAENLSRWFEGANAYVLAGDGRVRAIGALRGSQIQTVFVDPDLHGHGYGTRIMIHLEEQARLAGLRVVSLNSSLTSRAFYGRLGYTVVEETHGGVGGRMIVMRKSL